MKAVNPATEAIIREYPEHSDAEVQTRLKRAQECFHSWRQTSLAGRADLMTRAARLLRERREKYARLMTEEMGKPIAAAEAEIDKCAWNCEFYAEHAQAFLATQDVRTDASQSFIRYDPLGVVLAIMPWNFPFWQVFRFAAPESLWGRVVTYKG